MPGHWPPCRLENGSGGASLGCCSCPGAGRLPVGQRGVAPASETPLQMPLHAQACRALLMPLSILGVQSELNESTPDILLLLVTQFPNAAIPIFQYEPYSITNASAVKPPTQSPPIWPLDQLRHGPLTLEQERALKKQRRGSSLDNGKGRPQSSITCGWPFKIPEKGPGPRACAKKKRAWSKRPRLKHSIITSSCRVRGSQNFPANQPVSQQHSQSQPEIAICGKKKRMSRR
jgi:hypothetical protein